jgi:ATP-dependent Lhr-like helicase
LREDLIKSIAITLLYLKNFKEPLDIGKTHPSTLVHQVLSHCAQASGATSDDLQNIVNRGSFRNVVPLLDFKKLLDHLCDVGLLFKDKSEVYLPGRIGEKLVDHYEFYSVFLSSDQWSILHDGQLIGQIPVLGSYHENDNLLLGGRVWTVIAVIESTKKLLVAPAKNAKAPIFNAAFGNTHKAIHEKMFEIYNSEKEYPFVDPEGQRLLAEGRRSYLDLLALNKNSEKSMFPIFEGTLVQNTVSSILDLIKIEHGISEVCLEVKDSTGQWKDRLSATLKEIGSPLALTRMLPRKNKIIEKYDQFLPEDLLNSTYASTFFDFESTSQWLDNISGKKKITKA